MDNRNRVDLIGNIGKNPELRHTGTGTAVLNFTLATNERWKDAEGAQQEQTEWHQVVLWGTKAAGIAPHLRKGQAIGVTGKLRTRKWHDEKAGVDRYSTEIHADEILFLDSKPANGKGAARPDREPGADDAE